MHLFFLLYLTFLSFIALTVLYVFVLAIAGHLGRADDAITDADTTKKIIKSAEGFRNIGVLIPAYKEDRVIVETVSANLRQHYPTDRFELIVIADSLQPDTLARLNALPVRVIIVSFETSTVAKAINATLAQIADNQYDIITVSDADNLMAPDFLARINTAFGQGWRAVQGHRVAKNLNTNVDTGVAVLDAISEEINNHLFRKGNRALRLSAAIIGSGMGIEPRLMRAAMQHLVTMGGYDKELEMNLVLAGHTVGYLENALIYDEKVANSAGFEKQRTRWIAAQWQFLTAYFGRGLADAGRGRWGSFFKVAQALILPRVLLLGLLGLCTVTGLLSGNTLAWAVPLGTLLLLMVSLLLAIPAHLRQRITGRELLLVPVLMLRFARAVLNIRKAFKTFLPTAHTGE